MIKLEGTPGLDTNATWEEEIPEQNKITKDAVRKMMERQDRERQEGSLGADETLFPEGAPHVSGDGCGRANDRSLSVRDRQS